MTQVSEIHEVPQADDGIKDITWYAVERKLLSVPYNLLLFLYV